MASFPDVATDGLKGRGCYGMHGMSCSGPAFAVTHANNLELSGPHQNHHYSVRLSLGLAPLNYVGHLPKLFCEMSSRRWSTVEPDYVAHHAALICLVGKLTASLP
ncbi:MAG: hypothetical protein ACRBB0_27290, partial [Pelagimonas sp.]|uniref:hypothetical protein n=1 Tax=Pelagimonas sp. TaxID=2073170 RepID=UPI003D6C4ED2